MFFLLYILFKICQFERVTKVQRDLVQGRLLLFSQTERRSTAARRWVYRLNEMCRNKREPSMERRMGAYLTANVMCHFATSSRRGFIFDQYRLDAA